MKFCLQSPKYQISERVRLNEQEVICAPEDLERRLRMTPTIEAVGLRKRFGKTVALDGLDLVAETRS